MSDEIHTKDYEGPERRNGDSEKFTASVEQIFGKFALKFGWVIVGITASSAIAWISLLNSVNEIKKSSDENARLLEKTATSFSLWQSQVDIKLNGALSRDQYDYAVGIARSRDPKFPMPYMSEITAARK